MGTVHLMVFRMDLMVVLWPDQKYDITHLADGYWLLLNNSCSVIMHAPSDYERSQSNFTLQSPVKFSHLAVEGTLQVCPRKVKLDY